MAAIEQQLDEPATARKGERQAAERLSGRPSSPWFWEGMSPTAWFPLLVRHRFRITPRRWHVALLITWRTLGNCFLGMIQALLFGRRIARTQLQGDPIFIVGHWRSGTTLLHELLALDPRHTYPDTYDCFAPNHFLVSGWLYRPLLRRRLPKQRPMDNMSAGLDCPQEDEFALCNMGIASPYLTLMFCGEPPRYQEFLELKEISTKQRQRWTQGLRWFLKCVTLRSPRRIVLKSPPHTFRIRLLLEMFPRARFIHIVRNPYAVFPSTVHLWKKLCRDQGLQRPNFDGLEERVFDMFRRMYETLERDRPLIPPDQFCEVRYEDLVCSPIEQMQAIYRQLALGDFDQVRPAIEAYFARTADYQTNRYALSPELRAEITRRWGRFAEKYGYAVEAGSLACGQGAQ